MVRWERAREASLPEFHSYFQFHYGAMGAPFGSLVLRDIIVFQFHYGAMGALMLELGIYGKLQLSIPLWCDGSIDNLQLMTQAEHTFNSTMVRWELLPGLR